MASEHEHFFIWVHGRFECEKCSRSKEAIDLEQQLAQAREEITRYEQREIEHEAFFRKTMEQMQSANEGMHKRALKDEEKLAQARALLEKLANGEPIWLNVEADGWECVHCGMTSAGVGGSILHMTDCPIVRARAFLAREENTGGN